MRYISLLIFLGLMVPTLPAIAVKEDYACNVEDVQGHGHEVQLRNGTIGVTPYLPLQAGDQVRVKIGTVILRCGGQRIVVGPDQSPYVVPKPGSSPTIAKNVLEWLSKFFLEWSPPESTPFPAAVRSPGSPPRIPMLEGRTGQMDAERSTLALGWIEGQEPYTVWVWQKDGNRLLFSVTLSGTSLVVNSGEPLRPGMYRVEIVDQQGQAAEGRFQILPPGNLPSIPADFAAGPQEDLVRRTVAAAWLAVYKEGIFAFEAYQRAAEMAGRHEAARRLARALERGGSPGTPP